MENMIRKIVEADNQAKEFAAETLEEKKALKKEIDEQAEKIYSDYMKKAEETVKKNDLAEEKNAALQWEQIENKHKSVLIKMQSDFQRNAEKWANSIVKRTIG